MAEAQLLSVQELRTAVKDARRIGNLSGALALQASLERRSGLRLKPTSKPNSLTSAWLAAGVKSVRNIQYAWSAIGDDGVPVFTVWGQELAAKELKLSEVDWLVDTKGHADRKQHALVAPSKGGSARAFAPWRAPACELSVKEKSRIDFASTDPFEAHVERRGNDLWLVLGMTWRPKRLSRTNSPPSTMLY